MQKPAFVEQANVAGVHPTVFPERLGSQFGRIEIAHDRHRAADNDFDRFTRCPFPAATTDAPVAPVRSSNTAMEHQNCCTDLRHPELLAACCPYSSVHGK